jgi:hypothetical protein
VVPEVRWSEEEDSAHQGIREVLLPRAVFLRFLTLCVCVSLRLNGPNNGSEQFSVAESSQSSTCSVAAASSTGLVGAY